MSELIIRFQCEERGCTREAAVMGDPVGLEAIGWQCLSSFSSQVRCPEHRRDARDEPRRFAARLDFVQSIVRSVGELHRRFEGDALPSDSYVQRGDCKVCGTRRFAPVSDAPNMVACCNCGARYSVVPVR